MKEANFKPNKEEFINTYNILKSSRKVAKEYNVDKTTILNYAKKIGYNTSLKKKLSENDIDFILNNYHNYKAIELAEMFNVHQGNIYRIWNLNNLTGKQNRIYEIDENCFNNIDTEEKAYALGFIASDGCVFESDKHKKQGIIKITIHKDDIKILEMINKKVFKSNKPISILEPYCSLEQSSDIIVKNIKNLGLLPRKTYGNTYIELEDSLMRHFIRGYFDGDGSISKKCGKTKMLNDVTVAISGYEENMNKIINYLSTKNIYATFNEDKRKYKDNKKFGSLTLTNKTTKYSFLRYLYDDSTIYLERKKELANNFIKIIEEENNISDKVIITYYNYAVLKLS